MALSPPDDAYGLLFFRPFKPRGRLSLSRCSPVALVELDVGRAGIPSAEAISEIPSVPVAKPVRAPAPSAREVFYLQSVSVSSVCM